VTGPLETNPYRAPRSSTDAEERAASRTLPGFADQRNLVLVLTGLLGCQVITGALGAIVLVALFFFEPGSSRYASFGLLSLKLASVHDAFYYLTWIPFGWFLVRANRNARVMGGRRLYFTPASMVWWFAVPILNFIRPYQAVRAVWHASSSRRASSTSNPTLLLLWWALWVAAILFAAGRGMFLPAGQPELYRFAAVVTDALVAALAGAALVMVRVLQQRQRQRAAKLSAT